MRYYDPEEVLVNYVTHILGRELDDEEVFDLNDLISDIVIQESLDA